MLSSFGHKLTLLLPRLTVVSSFLNVDEILEIRNWFHNHDHLFNFKDSEDGVCQLRQCKLPASTFPHWKDKLQTPLDQLASNFGLGRLQLHFEDIYCKQYAPSDHYGQHTDLSPSGLTFLFQFALEKNVPPLPAFNLDGQLVNFKDNQLLIFHSALPHSYHHLVSKGTKSIIQVLPEIIRC